MAVERRLFGRNQERSAPIAALGGTEEKGGKGRKGASKKDKIAVIVVGSLSALMFVIVIYAWCYKSCSGP